MGATVDEALGTDIWCRELRVWRCLAEAEDQTNGRDRRCGNVNYHMREAMPRTEGPERGSRPELGRRRMKHRMR